ncbi:hypothetical protein RJ639_041666 [Escallonia herrerae]|uniref:Phytocyanin domain-containing protein n=1 Tax=Escallonia herrerae TaxID=1293975 RepID=A0AA88WLA8_9ASTE|nr:hypothetical protein RJ639_041666 [Escallonia herrerae]
MVSEGMQKRVVALLWAFVAALLRPSMADVYKVGDSAGWTTIGKVDYKQWAATKTFQVSDVILFEYSPQFHNVMQVTHAEYKACNASAPIATHTTGNDTITITSHGHHFFFCGVPGHCQAGQKVDINVLRASSAAPAPSTLPSPSVPASIVPSPSPSEAAPLLRTSGRLFCKLWLAVAVIGAIV